MIDSKKYKEMLEIIVKQDGSKKFFMFITYEFKDEDSTKGLRTDDIALNFSKLELLGLHNYIHKHIDKKMEIKCYSNEEIEI